MADRERKRVQRQKRKQRSSERAQAQLQNPASENGERSLTRSELKDRAAREALEPLHEDERPGIVTAAAIISAALVLLSAVGYALWDVLRDDARPPFSGVAVFVVLFGVMTWGLWRARYWAVLGFQTVLVFALVLSSLALITATTVLEAVGDIAIMAVSGYLFYRMVKAMARIQMPDRLPRE
jgi:hypothetical protein